MQAFDNAGWEIGTSSSLFNAILQTINSTVTSLDASVIEYLFDQLGNDVRDAGASSRGRPR